jgi:hypothetical protein
MQLAQSLADPLDKCLDQWDVSRKERQFEDMLGYYLENYQEYDGENWSETVRQYWIKQTGLGEFDDRGELTSGILFELHNDRWSYRRNFLSDMAEAAAEHNSYLESIQYDLSGLIYSPNHERLSFLRLVFREDGSLKSNEEISEAYFGNKNWNSVMEVGHKLSFYQWDADEILPEKQHPDLTAEERLWVLTYTDLVNYIEAYNDLETRLDQSTLRKNGELDCAHASSMKQLYQTFEEEEAWLSRMTTEVADVFGWDSNLENYIERRLQQTQEEGRELDKSLLELETELVELKNSGVALPSKCLEGIVP